MNGNYIYDKIFEASAKLELMQALIGDLINKTEKMRVDTFAVQQDTITSFLHIALDGICHSIKILDEAQEKGGETA